MILNSGLDFACTTPTIDVTNSTYRPFEEWVNHACFGTGSTAPAATDTSLDAQVGSRTTNKGGFDQVLNSGLDSGNDLIWYEVTFTRVFSIGSNVNAAEWGLAPGATGNLSVRDLFRADPNDPMSSPITLTLETSDELQLVVTVRVQAAWEYQNKSFVITGTAGNDTNGKHDGQASVSTGAATNQAHIIYALTACWPAGKGSAPAYFSYLTIYTSDQSSVALNQDFTGPIAGQSGVAATYTPGDHYRDYTFTFSTGEANADHYAYNAAASGPTGASLRGYRFIFDDPTHLTKASTHRLTLTVRKSIARL